MKTHDINGLLTLVRNAGIDLPDTVRESDRLTHFAVQTRYPGLAEDIDEEESGEALRLASAVLEWAEDVIGA